MNLNRANILTMIWLVILGLAIAFFVAGCFFARIDYEVDGTRVSGTVWTIGKKISIDPNGYYSDPQKLKVLYPPIMVETE